MRFFEYLSVTLQFIFLHVIGFFLRFLKFRWHSSFRINLILCEIKLRKLTAPATESLAFLLFLFFVWSFNVFLLFFLFCIHRFV